MRRLRDILGSSESADLPIADIVRAANESKHGKYITLDVNIYDVPDGVKIGASLRGGAHATLFRTLRNAQRPPFPIREYGTEISFVPEQLVMLFDLEQLPVVLPECVRIEDRPGYSEAAFAERQAELWAIRADRLMKEGR